MQKENLALYPSIWAGRPATGDEVRTLLAAVPDVPDRVGLEAAPGNVYATAATIEHVAALAGDGLRVLAVTRDRRRRLVSAHRFQLRRHRVSTRFTTFVRENLRGHAAGVGLRPGATPGFHVTSGLYGLWLTEWARRLGPRLGVVEDTSLHPTNARFTMDTIATWAGLPPWTGWKPGAWNRTAPSRWDRVAGRVGLRTDRLPPRLERQLAAIHAEDERRLAGLSGFDIREFRTPRSTP